MERAASVGILAVVADKGGRRMERRSIVFDQLDAEWARLSDTTRYECEFDRWCARYPAFAGVADCADVVTTLQDRSVDCDRKDAILRALLVQACRDGIANPIAARVVLQTMLPGVRARARRFRACDRDEADAAMLAGMIEAIAAYPYERRPRRVAANLLWLAFERAWKAIRRYDAEIPAGLDFAEPLPALSARSELLDLVRSAVASGVLQPDEARLVIRLRVADVPRAQVAVAEGVRGDAIYRRQRLAERRLCAAADELRAS